MNTLALRCGLPGELETLIDTGVLEITGEDDAEKTLHLIVPSLRQKDRKGRIKIVGITWIDADHNAQFCHYYHEIPGDLPNFYVALRSSRPKRCPAGSPVPAHRSHRPRHVNRVWPHTPQRGSCDTIDDTIGYSNCLKNSMRGFSMSLELSGDLRHAIDQAGTPLRLVDSKSGDAFVVVPESTYATIQALLGENLAETYPAQIESAMRAGWDDPAMDEYNDYDRHRTS